MALTEQQQQSLLGVTSFMFDYAPDQASYDRFASILEQNPSFYDLGTDLAKTDAFQSQYDGTTQGLIDLVFSRLNITEDTLAYTRGTDFITQRLDAGVSEGQVLMEVGEKLLQDTPPEGLEDAAAILQNKIAVSQAYLESGVEGYSSETLPDLLSNVTADQASVEAAQEKIDNLPTPSGGEGETFTLTTDTNVLTGTDGDDTFLAPDGSFQTFDQIDGGAGRDTLRVEAGDSVTGDISNIEVLSVEGDDVTNVNAASLDGLERINFVGTETAPVVTNLSANQTVSYENSDTTGTIATDVTLAEGNTTVNVALDDSNISVDQAAATAKTLNLSSEGTSTFAASGTNSFANNLSMVSVAASGELTLAGGSFGSDVDGDVTFDASASEGDITVTADVLDNVTNVIGGAGDDTLGQLDAATSVEAGAGDDTMDLSGNDVKVTVDAGAGDDRIELGTKTLSDTSIDGGEGNDTVVIGSSTFSTQSYDAINTLQNIETVEFSADGVSVDASELDASALTFTGTSATVENLGADQTVVASAGAEAATDTSTQTLNVEGDIADTVNVEASYNASGEEAGDDFSNTVTLNVADDEDVDSADTLNLSGNGNVVFVNGVAAPDAVEEVTDPDAGEVTTPAADAVAAGETFASVDASEMTGALTYTNVLGTKESITLGEDNGSDELTVAGSSYGKMDVITNFDSTVDEDAAAEGADVTADTLSGIFGGGNSATEVELGDDVTTLNDAFAAAASAADTDDATYSFFNFEDNTYVFNEVAGEGTPGEYDSADFAIQIMGTHDLSVDNAAIA